MKLNELNKFVKIFNIVIARNYPRHSIRFAKKYFKNKPITVAEIGTHEGDNALSILKNLNIKKMYLIDPYKDDEDYLKREPKWMRGLLKAEKKAKKRLKKYEQKIVWIKKYSDEAVNDLPDDLDFIYIDGNHDYKYVKRDIENYYPKIKKGSILTGHDICHHSFNKDIFRALAEFSIKENLSPRITRTDWWIIK